MNRNKQQAAKQASDAHRVNIQRSLEHRLQVARANNDEQLVRQLESEMSDFPRRNNQKLSAKGIKAKNRFQTIRPTLRLKTHLITPNKAIILSLIQISPKTRQG